MPTHTVFKALQNSEQAIWQCRTCGRLFKHTPQAAELLARDHERTGQ